VKVTWLSPTRGNPLTKPIYLTLDLGILAIRKLRFHPGLSVLALIGIVLSVGLVTSASFFAQAVDRVIMRGELAEYSRLTKRPPFATRIYTFSSQQVPLTVIRAETLGQDVSRTLSAEVGLPVKSFFMQFASGALSLQAQPGAEKYAGQGELGKVRLLYGSGIQDNIEIVAGDPFDASASTGAAMAVWMHTLLAERMGVQIGETFDLVLNQNGETIPVRLQGFWQIKATEGVDAFWLGANDDVQKDRLVISRDDFINRVQPLLPYQGRSVAWHVILDEDYVIPAEARNYVSGLERGQIIINKYLPDARLTAASLSLEKFVNRQTTLTTLLLGFNVPAFGFLLYFLILTSVVIAYWQRRETAVLVSRGMSISSLLNFTFVEELILIIIGLPLGLGLGIILARFMGDTVSFLSFIERDPLPVSLQGINISLTLVTLVVVLIARLWPTAQSAGQTILEQEREHARAMRGPFWYRNFLDLLLIVPTAYAYRQLADRGTLALMVSDHPEELFRDPLLVLVPGLFIITAALLVMRLFPLMMRLLDIFAGLTPWLTLHLAMRQLGRQGHSYINPLLLVIVSLALGVYSFSMAASLDQWLIDRMYYFSGADLTFQPREKTAGQEGGSGTVGGDWIPPKDEFASLPGVVEATRVGDYTAEISLPNRSKIRGRFLAVDRADFPAVAWFRDDFAAEPLGGLMNRLASSPDSVLVSQAFLEENQLRIGDTINLLVVLDFGSGTTSEFTIAGTYQNFPTIYNDEVTIIGNLEHLFSFFGLTMPHNIWLRTQDEASGKSILQAVSTTGVNAFDGKDARAMIDEELAKMERVGVFGTLSISFLAAAVMAALGLLTYSYASLQDRLYQFAMLRAMGLRRYKIIGQVILEYGLLTAYGAAAGVIVGTLAARLFIPFFRITGGAAALMPPLLPIIIQEEIIPFAISFAVLMILLELVVIATALYRRLFGMLRLGHQ
jgi:putative ABC transport system permease protein